MRAIEVIFEPAGIDQLPGDQPLDPLRPLLFRSAGALTALAGMLLADRLQQAIEERRLGAQHALQGGAAQQSASPCLLDQEVADQGVAGEVTAQHGVEADPGT